MAVIIIDIVLNGDKALDWGRHVLKLTISGVARIRKYEHGISRRGSGVLNVAG